MYSLVLIAVGLAMDVFSVSTVTGFVLKNVSLRQASKMSLSFGSFHILMPIIGWYMGSTVVEFVAGYDHWTAFLLLTLVGGKMIYEANTTKRRTREPTVLNGLNLLFFSVAVSIDALAVGLAFSLENIALLLPAMIIGITASAFTLLGLIVGSRTGRLFGKSVEIIGGLILIAIGLRIVFTHVL